MNDFYKIKILVVDDEPEITSMLKKYFSLCSKKVVVYTAADSKQGFLKLQNDPVDILICDLVLPGKSGLEFINMIYSDRFIKKPDQTFLMTGRLDADGFESTSKRIKHKLIQKPIDLDALWATILKMYPKLGKMP